MVQRLTTHIGRFVRAESLGRTIGAFNLVLVNDQLQKHLALKHECLFAAGLDLADLFNNVQGRLFLLELKVARGTPDSRVDQALVY